MIVRPVRSSDLPALIELARSTGTTGLTTLPANEERLAIGSAGPRRLSVAKPSAATPTTCSCWKTTKVGGGHQCHRRRRRPA
jgi:hypothetical protein